MVSRADRYDYDSNENNSRVARNQELYKRIYEDDSYLKTEEKPSDYTQEINIEKVKELLKGRENYRKEMLMREYNIIKDKKEEEPIEEAEEVKRYDINEYLNKAASEKEYQPYHKINPETLKKEEPIEETEETPTSNLESMGNTELSLDMFGDLTDKGKTVEITTTNIKLELTDKDEDEEENDDEEIEEETEDSEEEEDTEETEDDEFFTQSLKKQLNDSEEVEEGSSKSIKVIIAILVLIIIGLIAYLILM